MFHSESGEMISGNAPIPQGVDLKGMNDFQVMGAAITYLRRYQLSAMVCFGCRLCVIKRLSSLGW